MASRRSEVSVLFIGGSNLRCSLLALEFQVLWYGTDYCTGEELVAVAYSCTIKYGDAVHQNVIVAYYHILVLTIGVTDTKM